MKLTIRDHRTMRGLTLEQLAELSGISRSYLTELELGAKTINARRLEQIADALNLRVQELFELSTEPIPVIGRALGDGSVVLDGAKRRAVSCPPQLTPEGLAAIEVQEGAFAPIWQDGDLLFFYPVSGEQSVQPKALNRPAIVRTATGENIVAVLRWGSTPNRFSIEQLYPRATTEFDAFIESAARIELVLPAELTRTVDG